MNASPVRLGRGTVHNLKTDLSFAQPEEFPLKNGNGDTGLYRQGMAHQASGSKEIDPTANALETNEFDFAEADNIGDTGLLQDTGLVHKTPFKEENFNTLIPAQAEATKPNLDSDNHNFNRYCFVTNHKLLTSDIIPPEKEIVRLVKFFHHLSPSNQNKLLPMLGDYFLRAQTPNLEKMAVAVQKWFKQINELSDNEQKIVAIWLSRYCFDADRTLEEFKIFAAKNAADEITKKGKSRSTEPSFTPAYVSLPPQGNISTDKLRSRWKVPPLFEKLILPTIWVLATVILIALATLTNSSTKIIISSQTPLICQKTIGSPDYCRLAVNLAGAKTIARPPKSLFPLTEVTETVATYGCERYANLKAGITGDIAPEQTPVIYSYGEKIFSHLYVVEAEQKNAKQLGNTRVGCVYTTGQGQRSPKLLATDIIPTNWPTEHYQPAAKLNASLSFGIFTNPINLGLHTIFAALGIAIASRLNLGIKINQIQTVYLAALILGIVQIFASFVPFIGLVSSVTLPSLAVIIISFLLKDFKLDWQRGYPLVIAGLLVIVTAQFLFYTLCLGLIDRLS